jgi:endothelin-converting enzyme/putative endopeptidase
MIFAMRLLPSNTAAYALGLLTAYSQDAALETHGIAVANMDRSVNPGDDFYHYANGTWIQRTEIPLDRTYVGIWSSLTDLSRKRSADLIEDAAKANAPAGSGARKIADLYYSYMDEAAIEGKGLAPLRPHLDAIAAIRDKRDLARALGEGLRADVDPLNITNLHTPNLFGLWVAPGFNDPEHYAAYLLQGGLEMPNRDYYLSDSDSMKDIRAKYQAHVSALLRLAGFTDAEIRAQRILELEHAIAEKQISLADNDDIHRGEFNPQLYKNPTALRDITEGSNGAFQARKSWDACTGLGSPIGKAILKVFNHNT